MDGTAAARREARAPRSACAGRAAAAALLAAFSCAPAHAATAQSTFQVTATVIAACAVSASTLAFGDYDPTAAAPTDAATAVNVTCTNGTAYDVGLDEGAGAGATIDARKLTLGADTLTYALYQDGGRTILWGDTVSVDTLADSGAGVQQTHTIYGRIPAGQASPAGAYADTITVTVTF